MDHATLQNTEFSFSELSPQNNHVEIQQNTLNVVTSMSQRSSLIIGDWPWTGLDTNFSTYHCLHVGANDNLDVTSQKIFLLARQVFFFETSLEKHQDPKM